MEKRYKKMNIENIKNTKCCYIIVINTQVINIETIRDGTNYCHKIVSVWKILL